MSKGSAPTTLLEGYQEKLSGRGELLTQAQVQEAIRNASQGYGGQKALARQIGVPAQFLGLVARGKKRPSEKILNHFGFTRVVLYRAEIREVNEAQEISRETKEAA